MMPALFKELYTALGVIPAIFAISYAEWPDVYNVILSEGVIRYV